MCCLSDSEGHGKDDGASYFSLLGRWGFGAFLMVKPREKESKGGKEKIKEKALVYCCQSSLSLSWQRHSSTSASFHLHLVLVLTVLWFNTDRMWKVTLMDKNMGLFSSFLVFFLFLSFPLILLYPAGHLFKAGPPQGLHILKWGFPDTLAVVLALTFCLAPTDGWEAHMC